MVSSEPPLRSAEPGLARWRLAALSAACLVCLYLGAIVRATRWPMDADEAVHAVEGLRLYDHLAAGRIDAFLRDTYFPERWHPPLNDHLRWYPFVHAWSLLPAFALLGPDDVSARLLALAFLLGSAWVLFELAARLAPRQGGASGFLAVLLFLSAPNLLTFSTQCLIEPAALFTCFLALFLYLRSLEARHASRPALLAGAGLALAVLTKYDHGGWLAFSLGSAELLRARGSPLALLRSGAGRLFGSALAIVVLWFAHPDKRVALGDSLRHPFYGTPRTVLLDFVLTWFTEYGASLAAGGLALAAFFALARRLREPGLRAVWLWACLGAVFYGLRGRFHFRYNFVEAPIFLLLAGVAIPGWLERIASALAAPPMARRFRIALGGAIAGVLGLGAGLQAARSPASAYELLRGPFAWFHGLRADHWGLRLEPGFYIDHFVEHYAGLAANLGSGLAAASLGLLLLAALRGARRPLQPLAAKAAVGCVLAVATLPGVVRLYRHLPAMVEWELECHPELNEVYEFIRQNGPNGGTTLLGGGWDQLANNSLRWYLITRGEPRPRFDDVRVAGDMIGSVVFPPEPRIAWWAERLATAPAQELPERVVLVEPLERFLYHAPFGPEVEIYRALIEARRSHRSIARRRFPALDCTVEVFVREGASAPLAPPLALLRERGVVGSSISARRWVGEGGWEIRDDSLRHFARRER